MFFNLFGKKKVLAHQFTDIVFISQQAKEQAVITFARQTAETIFIAWFEQTALQFKQLFLQHGLDENRIEDANYFTAGKYTGRQIIFLERYPLAAKEEKLAQYCTQQNFTVYNSLTEPLLQQFGSQRIIELMPKMGYAEDEPIQHSMISKSIQRMQKKLATSVTLEQPATSQEEWMRKNMKQQPVK